MNELRTMKGKTMATTTIRVPDYFATADYADIQREVVGLVWNKHPALDGVPIAILGVRDALTYHAPGDAWPSLKHSKAIRTPHAVVEIRYERA